MLRNMSDSDAGLSSLAREMSDEQDLTDTMQFAVDAAVRLVGGCDYAGVSIVHKRRTIVTQAASHDVVRTSNDLQHDLGEGPILQALADRQLVSSPHLGLEHRWPHWAPRAHELGLRSMIGLQLYVGDRTYGTMSLYSSHLDAFSAADRDDAFVLAAQAAAAAAASQREEQLEAALGNRLVIGQAQGMLMQRYHLSAEQAFSVLTRASQDANRKLVEICRQLIDEGADTLRDSSPH